MRLDYEEIDSPIGKLLIVSGPRGVCALGLGDTPSVWAGLEARFGAIERFRAASRDGVSDRLRAYFAGRIEALDGIEVDAGGTPFQRDVWSALREIPAGQTRAYGDIARAIGRPKSARAVGMANGLNPVAVIVPCHRVIGADGSLTGYGGGIERKRWLLAHEGARGQTGFFAAEE